MSRHFCLLARAGAPLLGRNSVRYCTTKISPETGSAVAAASSGSVAHASATGSALAFPSKASRAADISYKGPIMEDLEGGARHANSIAKFYGNVPSNVRESFRSPTSMSEVPRNSAPQLLDSVGSRALAVLSSTGLAPERWSAGPPTSYYGGAIPLMPYKKGQTAAYHYPRVLVPRELAHRFPLDMYVDPTYASTDPLNKFRMRSHTLFPLLQGKTTLLLIFSGQPLSGIVTGLRRWLEEIGDDFRALPNSQVLKLHAAKGWFSRRTHFLTKFQLRRQVDEDELFKTFVYHGKWKWEYEKALHLYDKELPVALLIDPLGYIRWHVVGLPTEDATEVFRSLSGRLARERRTFA